jgi:hypothetical protein
MALQTEQFSPRKRTLRAANVAADIVKWQSFPFQQHAHAVPIPQQPAGRGAFPFTRLQLPSRFHQYFGQHKAHWIHHLVPRGAR